MTEKRMTVYPRSIGERARERAEAGTKQGRTSTPWLDPDRPLHEEGQEESEDRENYLSWAVKQTREAGLASDEYVEAMLIAIRANRTSYMAVEKALSILAANKAGKE